MRSPFYLLDMTAFRLSPPLFIGLHRTNDHSSERPSDAEPNHGLTFSGNNVRVFGPGVVSHYQPEGDIDHRHLDAEFQPDRRADVLGQSPFTLRSADDLEVLRLTPKENRLESVGEGSAVRAFCVIDLRLRRQDARRIDYHAAIRAEHRAGRIDQLVVDEVR